MLVFGRIIITILAVGRWQGTTAAEMVYTSLYQLFLK